MTDWEKLPRRNGLERGGILTLLFCPKEGCLYGFMIGCDYYKEGEFNLCAALDGSAMCDRFSRCRLRHFYKTAEKLKDALRRKPNNRRYVYGIAFDCFLSQICCKSVEANCVRNYYQRLNSKGGAAG
jgi:hypothetical protein